MLTIHCHLVPRLQMSGAAPVLLLFAVMSAQGQLYTFTYTKLQSFWFGKILLFYILLVLVVWWGTLCQNREFAVGLHICLEGFI